ncbi:hypothetical protein GA0070616_2499 [Micromonospora nigra]|uniref:Uncharacterized protein n=1 Tax=Micromonospora nigra TaxID=145857 RepID=A0A1C6RYH3_9ACTN|nr:hypothetical protein [Micromonospora nigra]SCL22238.1 hypothetical protein GA0070616_2499 [Micromonospora nigra]
MRKIRTLLGATLAGACAIAVAPGAVAAAPAAPQAASAVMDDVTGAFYPLAPARLMDTRNGTGVPAGRIGAGGKRDLQVAGRGGVPAAGAGAVVLNVTVTGPTAASFVTAWPTGEARPTASSVNFAKGWLGSNNVTVKLGADGKVSIYNHAGSTDVVVDVVGFYAGDNSLTNRNGGQYEPYWPERYWDTREDGLGKPPAGTTLEYALEFNEPGYNEHVKAFVLNITAVAPTKGGFLTAWSGKGSRPNASTVNYAAGKVVPNLAYVTTTPCTGGEEGGWCTPGSPKFSIYTSAAAHVLVDMVGVVDDGTSEYGLRFKPLSPTRIVDSRSGLGTPSALGANVTRTIVPPAEMLDPQTAALATNVTAVSPTNSTVVRAWPYYDEAPMPLTSNLNPEARQTVANAVLPPLGQNYAFNVHNLSGSTHLLVDVVGSFYYLELPEGGAAAARKAAGDRPAPKAASNRS